MAQAKEIKKVLTRKYGNRDFTGKIPNKRDKLTIHHIFANRFGGKLTLHNSALLCRSVHDKFNLIETKFPLIGETLNDDFLEYKQTQNEQIVKDNAYYIKKYYGRALKKCKKR